MEGGFLPEALDSETSRYSERERDFNGRRRGGGRGGETLSSNAFQASLHLEHAVQQREASSTLPSWALSSERSASQEGIQSRRGCERCTSLSYSEEYHKAFGVMLCNVCRKSESLISKVCFTVCECVLWIDRCCYDDELH